MKKLFCTIIILFIAGCANNMTPEGAMALRNFDTEMRLQRVERQTQRIEHQRFTESLGWP